MIEAILALGLVITTATQLRAGGLPLGPGEMLLLVWLCLAGLRQILSRPLIVNPALWRVIMFWCVFVVSLSVGMINGLIIEPFQDYQGIFRDTFAYALMLAISIMMAISLTDEAERRKVVWCIVLFGAM